MPMWSRMEAPDMVQGQYKLCFTDGAVHEHNAEAANSFAIELSFISTPVVYQSADLTLVLLGRIRPYHADYPVQTDLSWLATLWRHHVTANADLASFYQQIAGFFSLIVLSAEGLHLITDHVGSIPMYVHQNRQQCWVSDNLKHQKALALPLDNQALFHYFFFHCVPSEQSILQHTSKTGPGSCYQLVPAPQSGSIPALRRQNLYSPAYRYSSQTSEQLQTQCRQLIDTAVARNISPDCAAFLSGGLDSSTVSGVLSTYQPQARTFSIGFDAKGYDETEYALITARHFKTNHQVHYLQPQEIIDNFVDVAAFFDEPFGNSSAMAAFVCADVAKKAGVAVMLAGDGGDEIFAGNERYAKQKVFERFFALPAPLQTMLDSLTHSPLGSLPGFRKARSYVDQAKVALPDRLDSYNFLNRFAPAQIFCAEFLQSVDQHAPAQAKRQRYHECKASHPVEKMMYLDWKFTLADNDLVKVSTMCRKAGVAVRYPLFEKEVVDFSCTVPADIKLPGNKLRDFYKNSFKGFLADETLLKSKHGFGLPFGVWMKQQSALQELTAQCLAALKQRQIVQSAFIDQAFATYRSGHAGYYGELIWIMVVLELWLQGRERQSHVA